MSRASRHPMPRPQRNSLVQQSPRWAVITTKALRGTAGLVLNAKGDLDYSTHGLHGTATIIMDSDANLELVIPPTPGDAVVIEPESEIFLLRPDDELTQFAQEGELFVIVLQDDQSYGYYTEDTLVIPVGGYAAHYDAADLSSITASGGAVSQWRDKSSNAYHATQATAANKPTTGTRTQNGLNVLDFDGDFLDSLCPADNRPVSVFAVAQLDTWGDGGPSIVGPSTTSGGRQIQAIQGSNIVQISKEAVVALAAHNNDQISLNSPFVVAFVCNDTSIVSTLNGSMAEVDIDSTSWTAGKTLEIGAKVAGAQRFWDGWIAEIIQYNFAVTPEQRKSIERYLRRKWGTPTWAAPSAPVSGYLAWYDASDLSTISAAGDGAVNEWRDKSSNGLDLVGTVGTRPHSGTRQLGGRNVVDFDGTSEILVTSALPTLPQPVTVFAVFRADAFSAVGPRQEFIAFDLNGPEMSLDTTVGNRWRLRGFGTDVFGSVEANLQPHVMTGLANTTSSVLWLDGNQIGTGTIGAGDMTGLLLSLGNEINASAPYNGIVAEVLVYPSVLSDASRISVETYLKVKWGIA